MYRSHAKKFMGVLLSLFMVSSVLPFASFGAWAADDYVLVNTQAELTAAIADGAKIRLNADITDDRPTRTSPTVTIPADVSVTLDLNGHTLDRGRNVYGTIGLPTGGNAVTVNGSLTIEDSTGTNRGKIRGGYNKNKGGGVIVNGGSLILNSGSICDSLSYTAKDGGGGVYVKSGSFTMNGGYIYNCAAGDTSSENTQGCGGGVFVEDGAFTMNGGKIFCNGQGTTDHSIITAYGGAVGVGSNGTFNMAGGSIGEIDYDFCNRVNNQAVRNGGAVYLKGEGATFNMSGGMIRAGVTDGDCSGVFVGESAEFNLSGDGVIIDMDLQAVKVEKNAAFNMTGGAIKKNETGSSDGVVYVNGSFTMTGGRIEENKASYGGGVFVDYYGSFVLNGGVITGNCADYAGGGVYLKPNTGDDSLNGNGGTFTFKSGEITNNKLLSFNESNLRDILGCCDGGGVWVGKYCTFNMEGGSITGNRSALLLSLVQSQYSPEDYLLYNDGTNYLGLGGGVFVHEYGTFNIKGACTIQDNYIGSKPESMAPVAESNVYLEKSRSLITVADAIEGSSIGITPRYKYSRQTSLSTDLNDYEDSVTITKDYSTYCSTLPLACFLSDFAGFEVVRTRDGEAQLLKHTHDYAYNVNADGDALTIACDNDCSNTATLRIRADGGEYTGEAYAASLEGLEAFNLLSQASVSESDIAYFGGGAQLDGAPREIGDYTARLTYTAGGAEYTIQKDFSITVAPHTHTWAFDEIKWEGDNASGYMAAAYYHCTFVGCEETTTAAAAVSPAVLPAARCLEAQTVTLTATVAATDSPDGSEHNDAKDVTVDAIGSHDFDESIAENVTVVPATCLVDGSKTVKCSRCDAVDVTTLYAPGSHDFDESIAENVTVVAATCLVDGSKTVKCSRCDAVDETTLYAPGSHDFDESIEENVTVVPATCLVDGSKIVKCSRCDAVDETTLYAPGSHDFDESIAENVTVVPATCTEDGSKTVKCSRCDAMEETVLKAPGHAWGGWETVTAATATEKGLERRTCSRCDATAEREIPAKNEEQEHLTIHCKFFERIIEFFTKLIKMFTSSSKNIC